ncbi:hypothetical protein PTSG_06773 [Salpingoeca rosetta]|uniref:Uncharacterized protein n=1 Tax=Salpingoeca rosetta (strain ATCC 50818 / BSB-021) TaxID=946362 RepID=F2UER8_SALR5|nr:uncharacterized protein PTSG_06773 [Salpingoeca rosetta]EGD75118.1 hypothetical protein PTSG_06773 [Salpingoeca rosetta]|eukprot:XP_004992171.1 hypothetical protein PTSG_06773 [Salpingoeca rosetta]
MRRLCMLGVWVWEAVCLLSLAIMGGVLNHMRGSSGGVLTSDAFTASCDSKNCVGYWVAHVYTRLLMALPTAALVQLLSRNTKLTLVFAFATFVSIFVGWGCYFSIGWSDTGYNSRSGFLDWLIGRELEGWDFSRRFIRDYAGMGMRGLMWTLPAGYVMHHEGYGWQFSLSGAVMPAIYAFGFRDHPIWTADGWQPLTCSDPPFSQDWAFSTGTPMSEFLFGTWFWMCLLVALLRRSPSRSQVRRHRSSLLYEVLCWVVCIIFFVSSCWYASVKQDDKSNWGQTLVGCALSTLVLLIALVLEVRRRRCRRNAAGSEGVLLIQNTYGHTRVRKAYTGRDFEGGGGYEPLGTDDLHDAYFSSDDDDVDDDEDVIATTTAIGVYKDPDAISTTSRQKRGREHPLFVWFERFLGLLSVLSLLAILAFCLTALGWNWHTPRYCTSTHAPNCH